MRQTNEIIEMLRLLENNYKGFGIEEEVVREAADRLTKQQKRIRNQRREIEALAKDKQRVDGFLNWLSAEIKKCEGESIWATSNRAWALYEARRQLNKLRNGLGESSKSANQDCELCDGLGGYAIVGSVGAGQTCPRCNGTGKQ